MRDLDLDEVGATIASVGTPAILFLAAMANAGAMGLAGGAVVTTALAMLGGPLGMIGGVGMLMFIPTMSRAVSKFGIEALFLATYKAQMKKGRLLTDIINDIDKLKISESLKATLKRKLSSESTAY